MVKEIYSRAWDFKLYNTENGIVLSVIFFGIVDFHRSFKLSEADLPVDLEDLKSLSEEIRNNYDKYKEIEIIPAIINEALDI